MHWSLAIRVKTDHCPEAAIAWERFADPNASAFSRARDFGQILFQPETRIHSAKKKGGHVAASRKFP
ncbi:hypothetical protein [Mesorhizobium amorphae]|uniref:hypothetical protein n=1 Tax=Mesorhizobium amorphae TaxID=71433 RepID=UPI0011845B96|nr:hypothetical protein [Mesorhizobium amorphae]